MCQSMDASNAVARVLSHAARKISGEDGFCAKDSKHCAGMSNTLGYGAIIEGREGAYIMANALASPSALQEIYSIQIIRGFRSFQHNANLPKANLVASPSSSPTLHLQPSV